MFKFKQRIYKIIEADREHDIASHSYDMLIFVSIIVGLIPLTMKTDNIYTKHIDLLVGLIFIFDYSVRLYTADFKMGVKSYKSYIAYALSPMAIIDFISTIPILAVFMPANTIVGLFRLFRILRVIRVLRLLKFLRYSRTFVMIKNVVRRVKQQLFAVLVMVLVYIIASAMVMFAVEPSLFDTFFDAVYWATVSITTIGYGDIAPHTIIGKFITIISALIGMAVIALPTGIITAGYMEEMKKVKGKHEL